MTQEKVLLEVLTEAFELADKAQDMLFYPQETTEDLSSLQLQLQSMEDLVKGIRPHTERTQLLHMSLRTLAQHVRRQLTGVEAYRSHEERVGVSRAYLMQAGSKLAESTK